MQEPKRNDWQWLCWLLAGVGLWLLAGGAGAMVDALRRWLANVLFDWAWRLWPDPRRHVIEDEYGPLGEVTYLDECDQARGYPPIDC